MLNDKQDNPVTGPIEGKDKGVLKEQNGNKKLKSLNFDSSSGFICDINTGICGPVTQKKEGEK
ncbi:hypothetical protein [Bacillus sinesaloumensis]|uniref:hypothetical protein n=1 Tax=Litchfieldia sinesaloumensis TaxID=1926280 RepID=UPI000988900A|nr:hypothetical protein [Bacillus sinesaloumensis]